MSKTIWVKEAQHRVLGPLQILCERVEMGYNQFKFIVERKSGSGKPMYECLLPGGLTKLFLAECIQTDDSPPTELIIKKSICRKAKPPERIAGVGSCSMESTRLDCNGWSCEEYATVVDSNQIGGLSE